MAVLIPDMEMPDTCSECPCYDAEHEWCNVTEKEIIWCKPALTTRAEDCPLVEVQKPKRIMSREAMEAAGFEV